MGGFTLLQAGIAGKLVYPSIRVGSGGAVFQFNYPPREFPGFRNQRFGKDTLSGDGHQQSMTQFIDTRFDFRVPFVPPADVASWFAWSISALNRVPFDFYPDASQPGFFTCVLVDDAVELPYQVPGRYELKTITIRILIS